MNTTDAEIAGKLDGMECGDYGVKRIASTGPEILVSLEDLIATDNGGNYFVTFYPSELLAFCRAVVERCDGKKYTMDEMRIYAKEYAECGKVEGERCPRWKNGSCLIGLAETKGETL